MSALVNSASGRRLDADSARCENIKAVREVVTDLGLVTTKDDEPGAFVHVVNSNFVRMAASVSSANSVGNITLGNVSVDVPSDIGGGTRELTTVLLQFDFNVRVCDDLAVDLLDSIVDEEKCEDSLKDAVTALSPLRPPESVISLEFRTSLAGGGGIAVEPAGLEEPIVLRLPLGDLGAEPDGLCSNFTGLSCGFYNSSAAGFRSDGCSVAAVDFEKGYLLCACNHASDYAAWIAFQEDVINVFTKPISIMTLFAVVLSTAILCSVFLVYCLCFMWGNYKDKKTAQALQREAVGIMVLQRHLLKQRQRQFFSNLRVAMKSGKASEHITESPASKGKSTSLLRRTITAIQYEHSLLGLARYDPHYTRIQRVSIFAAVVMGNLFVAALFFELKDSEIDDLSPGFIVRKSKEASRCNLLTCSLSSRGSRFILGSSDTNSIHHQDGISYE